jgi:flagellar motor switch protein FliM
MKLPSREASMPLDRVVLARLTGEMGDARTITRCCSDVAALQSLLLRDVVRDDMQLEIDVEPSANATGLRSNLAGRLGDGYTLASCSLPGWCSHFVLAARNDLPIAMIAHLLGDSGDDDQDAHERALTSIESDVAALLFSRVVDVLRSGILSSAGETPVISKPYGGTEYAIQAADVADTFAASIGLRVTLGALVSEILLIIPQQILLKTPISRPGGHALDDHTDASDTAADHVLLSQIDLRARVKLTPLKLGSVARLRPGDVIPFEDLGDVAVDMDANGKLIYRCEFGRSGDNYSVKIKSNATPDGDILKQILDT